DADSDDAAATAADDADDATAPVVLSDHAPPDVAVPIAQSGPTAPDVPADERDAADPRDYDVEHYLRVLRDTYAARLARALTPDDFAAVFADPEQPSLFAPSLAEVRPVLTAIVQPALDADEQRPGGDDDDDDARDALHR